MKLITRIALALGFKHCPRCGHLYLRERGTMVVMFGKDEEYGGTMVQWEPTCCGKDEAAEWLEETG